MKPEYEDMSKDVVMEQDVGHRAGHGAQDREEVFQQTRGSGEKLESEGRRGGIVLSATLGRAVKVKEQEVVEEEQVNEEDNILQEITASSKRWSTRRHIDLERFRLEASSR